MRKRKSPIALVSLLALVVVGVACFNFYASRPNAAPGQQAPPPEVPDTKIVGTPRTATSSSTIAQTMKASLNAPRAAHTMTEDGPGGPGGPGSGPLILGPDRGSTKPEKPKPNSSSTSSQWYNSESSLSDQKK